MIPSAFGQGLLNPSDTEEGLAKNKKFLKNRISLLGKYQREFNSLIRKGKLKEAATLHFEERFCGQRTNSSYGPFLLEKDYEGNILKVKMLVRAESTTIFKRMVKNLMQKGEYRNLLSIIKKEHARYPSQCWADSNLW